MHTARGLTMPMPTPDVGGWTGIILGGLVSIALAGSKLRKLLASDKADTAGENGRFDIVSGLREQLKYEREQHAQALQFVQARNDKLAVALSTAQSQLDDAHGQIGELRAQVVHLSDQVAALQAQISKMPGLAP